MRLPAIFLLFALCSGTALRAQAPLDLFFETADSVTEHAPFKSELTTFCQVRILGRYVSFVGYKNSRTLLYVTFTRDSVADPVMDVSPIVGFDKAKPTLGKVETWGYPFDRNRDGKIDYLALVGGAAPFEDGDFPANFPVNDQPLMVRHVQLYLEKCRILFNHWADDNYDGKLDAVVHADMDPGRAWVYRYIFAAFSPREGTLDTAWTFRTDTSSFDHSLGTTPEGVRYHPVGRPPGILGGKDLDEKSAVMTLINQAVDSCGRGSFRISNGFAPDPGR